MPENQQKGKSARGPLVALVVVVLVLLAAIALIRELAKADRVQDCVLAGRSNCAPIRTPGG